MLTWTMTWQAALAAVLALCDVAGLVVLLTRFPARALQPSVRPVAAGLGACRGMIL